MADVSELETPFRPLTDLVRAGSGSIGEAEGETARRWAPSPGFISVVDRSVLASAGMASEVEAEAQNLEGPALQDIIGTDDRKFVSDTVPVPFRFVCALDLLFRTPDQKQVLVLRGSGTLISDRHVLTAGHNIVGSLDHFPEARAAGFTAGQLRPDAIFATPARHGTLRPFGFSRALRTRASPRWESGNDRQFDFGLLTLFHSLGSPPRPLLDGRPLGHWGHPKFGGGTRINPLPAAKLRGLPVNVSGYPNDKCRDGPVGRAATAAEMQACPFLDRGSMQFRSFGKATHVPDPGLPRMFRHDLDTARGHSGSPTWLRWQNFRNLVGIHQGGRERDVSPFDIIGGLDVLITEELLKQVRAWMREDGTQAAF